MKKALLLLMILPMIVRKIVMKFGAEMQPSMNAVYAMDQEQQLIVDVMVLKKENVIVMAMY